MGFGPLWSLLLERNSGCLFVCRLASAPSVRKTRSLAFLYFHPPRALPNTAVQVQLEDEKLAKWLVDLSLDKEQRDSRVSAMLLPSCCVYSTMEDEAIATCLGIFGLLEKSSIGATELKHSVRISRLETKHDEATGLLLGRANAAIRAPVREKVAHLLNFDGRFVASLNAADRNLVRSEVLAPWLTRTTQLC